MKAGGPRPRANAYAVPTFPATERMVLPKIPRLVSDFPAPTILVKNFLKSLRSVCESL
jgi:hypothetical protein